MITNNKFQRLKLLIGEENFSKLKEATVAVFGIGGVGSFTVEALARAGVGHLILIDKDNIDETNINRQIHALSSTIGNCTNQNFSCQRKRAAQKSDSSACR